MFLRGIPLRNAGQPGRARLGLFCRRERGTQALRRKKNWKMKRPAIGETEGSEPRTEPRKVQTLSSKLGGKDDSYVEWNDLLPVLREAEVESLAPELVAQLVGDGEAVLIDVREESQFREAHVSGSVNVPLFVPCGGDTAYDKLRRLTFRLIPAFYGLEPTERNPFFVDSVLGLVSRWDKVVLLCERGGSIDSFPMPSGVPSRSLKAAYELLVAGVASDKIHFVKGGMIACSEAGLNLDASENHV
mmetsp:Transcript_34533/g.81868  ORF Transcript_34533/g.81868 Transcript_34533/m.81868 type:complete len:245 (-) Transcript_34533:99-833(-)